MKAESATWIRACAKIVKDAIWIRGLISGLLNMFAARKPERRYTVIERVRPRRISKDIAAARMFFILFGAFSWLYWAVYLIVAWSIPKSLNCWMRRGAVNAIV